MKKKLKLSQLNVQSFVTETREENGKTLKGGGADTTVNIYIDRDAIPTKYCYSVYQCPVPTLPAAACTSNYTVERCPTLPIEDCLWIAVG